MNEWIFEMRGKIGIIQSIKNNKYIRFHGGKSNLVDSKDDATRVKVKGFDLSIGGDLESYKINYSSY